MRVTLLGHASVLVEMEGAVCLMDPVFFDPFEEGAVVSCPARTVHVERLPPIDLLVVSHRHPDHFDIASLAWVPRECDAICPADPLIVYGLKRLGFTRIHPVEPMGEISTDGFELYPTRSEAATVREFGMVFRDRGGVFFNQVDTFLSDATISAIGRRFGQVDLQFAMYASQNFEFFDSRAVEFPYATHRRNLETAIAIGPRMLAPGSAGFRFCGGHAWLNAFLFPISAHRFIGDLRRLAPEIQTCIMNPGDVFEINGGGISHLPAASCCATTLRDDRALIEFDPTAPIPPLTDPNVEGWPAAKLEQTTGSFVGEQMAAFVTGAQAQHDPVITLYRNHRVAFAVGVVMPDGGTRWYRFDFSTRQPVLSTGWSPPARADIVHRIAASALAGWIERRKSFFYVRAYSRRWSASYELARTGNGGISLQPLALPDLLMHYLLNVAPGSETAARRHIDLEIDALNAVQRSADS